MKRRLLVITPWKRRWEMGQRAGLADDHYFIRELTARGWEVHYLAPRHRGDDVTMRGYVVHEFPDILSATDRWPTFLKRPLWPALFTILATACGFGVARRTSPDLVLGHTHLSAWATWLLARMLRIPSAVKLFGVVELDRTDWPRWRYLRKNVEQLMAFRVPVDAWIILDDGSGGAMAARRNGVSPRRVHELPNGVNLEWGARKPDQTVRARLGIAAGAPVVLFLARLTAWKRPDVFLQVAAHVCENRHEPVHFVVGGDGVLRKRCESLARQLGIANIVHFAGPVPHDDVPALMSTAAVFASTSERTNRGIPACEAMVCGVPVVAFDVGDTRAVLHDGENGILVPDGDVEAFSCAVLDLLRDPERRRQLGGHARAFAQSAFTGWPQRIEMELRILESLIDGNR